MGFPQASVLDDFNRANEGPPPSASWVTSVGTGLAVVSNVCAKAGITDDAATWNTSYVADQEVYATIATATPVSGGYSQSLYTRLVTADSFASDHYEASFGNDGGGLGLCNIYLVNNSGTYTQLGDTIALAAGLAIGDRMGFRVYGNTIEAYLNEQLIGKRTDTVLTNAGYIGLRMGATHPSSFENFGGGKFTPSPNIASLLPILVMA